MTDQQKGTWIGNFPCPSCGSSDANAIYLKENEDGEYYDANCFSCNTYFTHNQLVEAGVMSGDFKVDKGNLPKPKERMTKEEYKELCSRTNFNGTMKDGSQYRGIRNDVLEFYGHRIERDKAGDIVAVYYPETVDGKAWGFKSRVLPKKFGWRNVGKTGLGSDLSGEHKFQSGGKYVLIAGGEQDKCAAFQMLRDYQISKNQGDYDPYAVVSVTTGEGSGAKQCANRYEFLDSFDNIIVCMDNDEKGREAAEEIVKVLPKDKVRTMTTSGKDANQMLLDGRQKQFISNFFDAKPVVGDSVKTSKEADDEMEKELGRQSITLPDFMSDLQDAMAGGIRLGYLVVLAAQTGGGKTTIINEAVYHWIFNSPYKVGLLSLELNAGQYQTVLLSRHIGHNINLISSPEERVKFVQQDWVVEQRKILRETEYGEPRYSLLDERDGSLEEIKRQINKMICRDDCKVIVIDPVQDLFEGVGIEEQTSFIKYLKTLVKDGITVIAVAHITKGRTEVDKKTGKRIMRLLTEDDLAGVSNLAKSSGCTVMTSRDKYAEDEEERNTTYPTVPKCRWSGFTGDVDPWVYDRKTHTMRGKSQLSEDVADEGQPIEEISNEPEF